MSEAPRPVTELPHGLHREQASFRYYAWLAERFRPHLAGRVLEHGAGSGALSRALLAAGARHLVTSEPEPELVEILRAAFAGDARVSVFAGSIEAYLAERGPGTVDSIVSSNVLEHVADDAGCLESMLELLRPGGALCLYVPARPELYGPFDHAVGHQRRYTKPELAQKLEHAGFVIERLDYRNLVGALGWFVNQRILRRQSIDQGTIGLYDRVIFPLSCRIEERLTPPYGLNLLGIARRPRAS